MYISPFIIFFRFYITGFVADNIDIGEVKYRGLRLWFWKCMVRTCKLFSFKYSVSSEYFIVLAMSFFSDNNKMFFKYVGASLSSVKIVLCAVIPTPPSVHALSEKGVENMDICTSELNSLKDEVLICFVIIVNTHADSNVWMFHNVTYFCLTYTDVWSHITWLLKRIDANKCWRSWLMTWCSRKRQ